MTTESVTETTVWRPASEVAAGDRIAAGFLPDGEAAEVLFTYAYDLSANSEPFVLVVYRADDSDPDVEHFRADARIPLEAFTNGPEYDRANHADADTTPVPESRRYPPHTGGVVGPVDGGRLVDETGPTCQFEFGGGSVVRQRCGEPIRWDERYDKWVHADGVWPGHDAIAPTVAETGWRDEATGLVSGGLVPNCPTCDGDHHTVEPCR